MQLKIQEQLESHAGSLETKPPWMKQSTFNRMRKRYVNYDKKSFVALNNEINNLYPEKITTYLAQCHSLYLPAHLLDVYDEMA